MVRETRHLWVGNLPDNIREDRIREHFKRYGRVQNAKLLGRPESASAGVGATGASGICATVAFMDIKSASKAHNTEHVLDERTLTTEYYEPAAIPSTAGAPSAGSSPAGSGYSGSSSSVNSVPAPSSAPRYQLSGGEDSSGATTCPIAASAAAPANWRGTNDSATEYCRRGNTPATYGRYQRNNSTAPLSTPPSNVERTTPHRWYGSSERATATGGESTPSTPGGGTESGRRRRNSGSASSRSDSTSPEPSDTSRASTPPTQPPLSHHNNHRTPTSLNHQWASTASGRPLAICVRNLPTRSTDSSLKDGLYHEYKKHGKVVWVKVVGQNADRYAVVRFKKPSDVEKALEVSQDKLFFGCKISVAPHQSGDDDAESAKPYETDIDEYHPKATRTLFIGNLEKDVTQQQLRDKFKHFGRIIEIDIKKGSGGGAGYAFCQYASISSVVEAIRAVDGEHVGGSRVKLGFGKPVATACVWVDGLTEHTEKQVLGAVSRCGAATSVCVDRAAGAALVHFEQAAGAGAAVRELRRVAAAASAVEPDLPRLCVDYASRECQDAFYEQLEKHGGSAALAGSERLSSELTGRYVPSSRHDSLRFEGTRSRASSFGRSCSRTPRYSTLEHYDPVDYAADRRYRVYDEPGTSPSPDDAVPFEDRLQSVVVSPHRARRHRRDSSPEDRKHSKERLRSISGSIRRSRSGSGGRERHARRRHRRKRDGSSSRAGTPLRDELDAPPAEPRRPPRERPALPMCLPLPKFAAQIVRAAPAIPPRPVPPPAPDSPPRPPSVSSSSGGSAPHSPSLEERIRSLDEKYEKWSVSRVVADAPERARLRHRLLEVDINEVKPSEVVRSLLAKRSVFDEDSERLEVATRAPTPPDTPRALRYTFPVHAHTPRSSSTSTPSHDTYHEVDVSDRLPDPRLNRPDKFNRKHKVGISIDNEYVEAREPRGRPRTPSTDRSQQESCGRRSPSTLPDGDVESGSRDSASGTGDAESKSSFDTDEKDSASQRERANSAASDSLLAVKSDGLENIPMPLPRNNSCENCDESRKSESSQHVHSDEICARDIMDMLLNKVENSQKIDPALETTRKLCKYDFRKDEHNTNEAQLEKLKKLECTSNPLFDLNLEIKESIEHELQNHINESNSVKPNCEKSDVHFSDAVLKEKEKNNSTSTMFRNTQFEKENIKIENSFENENHSSGNNSAAVVSTAASKSQHQDVEKSVDDRIRNDRDKSKSNRSKDKHESDKDKLKSNRNDKNEKEKKHRDENLTEKHSDKLDSLKHVDKNLKDKSESEKSRHSDNKPRHVYHRRDSKSEKEKRKDSEDTNHAKTRKEDKHKTDKPKKETELKREIKKETEQVKSRKSSRDESTTREISRKDSSDSATSRTSHEYKIKDFDCHDIRDDMRPKVRLTDLFVKLEKNKDFHNTKDGVIKIKHENDKIVAYRADAQSVASDQANKPKADIIDKQRHHSVDSPSVDSKRKERLNSCSSLPSNIGHKRRVSSQENIDLLLDETKKIKSEPKIPERRDSKESRSGDRHKTTKFSKGHFAKIIESKTKDDKKNQVKSPDDSFLEIKEIKEEKISISLPINKSSQDENCENTTNDRKDEIHNNLDFLALLELRSSEEDEKQKALRKEMKEKKRIQQLQQIQELQMQQEVEMGKLKDDKKQKSEDKKRDSYCEKRLSTERKSREDKGDSSKRKSRKPLQSSDTSDSDEPKKHSIFDIVDEGPTYISMYDKVKARSCKNMQKQEAEKRQEKIKAKFSQLKQSRAKREEKKRSSWDEDSDSDQDERKHKSSLDSSDDDSSANHKRDKLEASSIEFDENKTEDYFSMPNDEDHRNKLSRKNSRSRIISDTSDDESAKNKCLNFMRDEIKKLNASNPESLPDKADHSHDYCDDKITKNSLLNLFGKSDSDDSRIKSSLENDTNFKPMNIKTFCNDLSSECESVSSSRNVDMRRKHKKKQKKYKSTYTDDENKIETSDTGACDSEMKHKKTIKQRRHSSKKDKRKERIRDSNDTDDGREDKTITIKREKKSPEINYDYENDVANHIKRDGKMEDIFGPLSDESDKDNKHQNNKSDFSSHDYDTHFCMSDMPMNSIHEQNMNKDMKRKKEKRRKEKRWFSKDDDNSLDVDAVGKAIEANLLTINDDTENIRSGNELKYVNGNFNKLNNCKNDKYRRDSKEKRKKKKRSREERLGRKEHHFIYQRESCDKADNNTHDTPLIDTVSNAMLLDIPLPNENIDDTIDDCKSLSHSPSLPRLTESPPILIESSQDADVKSTISSISNPNLSADDNSQFVVDGKDIEIEQIPMPPPFENIVHDISEVPLPAEPAPSPVIENKTNTTKSSLTSDSDTSDDVAGTNISVKEIETDIVEKTVEMPTSKIEKKPEEKPRAIISQEETEDAVAALLGESFGGKINTFSSYEETEISSTHPADIETTTLNNENFPEEDAEEMRQAVQNLNACEMEMKPGTPVSDSDLLMIDTDTEETDEAPSVAIDKTPVNFVAMNRTINNNSEHKKSAEENTVEAPSQKLKTEKPPISAVFTKTTQSETNVKTSESDVKIKLATRENVQIISSAATPVITSWTLTNNKMRDPHIINIPSTMAITNNQSENNPSLISNIVQIKTSQPQNVLANNLVKPIMSPARLGAPYQVINQIVRPSSSNMQPPTIKIPEPHILYQKSQGIVISPRIPNDPRMQSPKASPQAEAITSPRLPNMTILTSTPQNLNSVGMMSPTSKLQRSPGQVTVVRVQQPPLSPIQSLHGVHSARTMVSPNRPNSVLVQGAPLHFNRLPVTPVLTPIPKQINMNSAMHQNKNVVSSTPLVPQHKGYTGENRKIDHGALGNENTKIVLSPTSLHQHTNATVLAQNRLISMQNAVHLGNINSALHLGNKVVINKMNQILEKRDNQPAKSSDHVNHSMFGTNPVIHVAGSHSSTTSTPSIIQSGTKSKMTNSQEPIINIIHTQRLMNTCVVSKSNVIQIDKSKIIPSVLSMANMRPSTVLTKLEKTSLSSPINNASHTVASPILLKPINNLRINTKPEQDHIETKTTVLNELRPEENVEPISAKIPESEKNILLPKSSVPIPNISAQENFAKCETDFEELLKDNTNEIKVTNNLEKKLEVNVGKTSTIIKPNHLNEKQTLKVMECIPTKKDQDFTALDRTTVEVCGISQKEDKILKEPIKSTIIHNNSVSCLNNTMQPSDNSKDTSVQASEIRQNPENKCTEDSKHISSTEKASKETEDIMQSFEFMKDTSIEDTSKDAASQDDYDQLKNLVENDSWSVKDLNIESVIKKVDSLCNDQIDYVQTGDIDKIIKDIVPETKAVNITDTTPPKPVDSTAPAATMTFENNLINMNETFNTEITLNASKRGGRNMRGKKGQKGQDKVQTRMISKPARGTTTKRGRGRAKIDKNIKNFVSNSGSTLPGDIYDFHEDSGDETSNKSETRPRLILTIKSPLSGQAVVTATSTLSISQKDQNKAIEKISKDEKIEDFVSPSTNTRKSRRLQEKDVQRNVADDEDGSPTQARGVKRTRPKQAGGKPASVGEKSAAADTRKSPRGSKRTRDRSLSDASTESGEGETKKDEAIREPKVARLDELIAHETEPQVQPIRSTTQAHTTPVPAPSQHTLPVSRPPVTHIAPANITPIVTSAPPPAAPPLVPLAAPPTLLAAPQPTPTIISTAITAPVSLPPAIPTPITKPPKKMISEIAKLAGVFDTPPQYRPEPEPLRDPSPVAPATGDAHAADTRRPMDMPVGATEVSDARVQSPALPHRPPSGNRLPVTGRATPILIRGGEGEVGLNAVAGSARYIASASLPARGAHHPPPPDPLAHVKHAMHHVPIHHHHHPGATSRITSVPAISPQGQMATSVDLIRSPPPAHQQTSPVTAGDGMYPHFSHQHYQMYQSHFRATQHEPRAAQSPFTRLEAEGSEAPTPPLELRRPPSARVPRPAHSPSTADRLIMYAAGCGRSPPPAHTSGVPRVTSALPPIAAPGPPHASQVPREADSLQMLLRRYPVMWQGLLALKNDSAAVQMHFVGGNPGVAGDTLARADAGTPMLRIAQRMRLEPDQLNQVHRKMKLEQEHCILLALPCGRDHMDVLQQSTNLTSGFITYLQRKQAAGIVNIAPPGHQQAMFTVHIFPSCEFANENLTRIAPDLMHRVADIAHLLIVIATV